MSATGPTGRAPSSESRPGFGLRRLPSRSLSTRSFLACSLGCSPSRPGFGWGASWDFPFPGSRTMAPTSGCSRRPRARRLQSSKAHRGLCLLKPFPFPLLQWCPGSPPRPGGQADPVPFRRGLSPRSTVPLPRPMGRSKPWSRPPHRTSKRPSSFRCRRFTRPRPSPSHAPGPRQVRRRGDRSSPQPTQRMRTGPRKPVVSKSGRPSGQRSRDLLQSRHPDFNGTPRESRIPRRPRLLSPRLSPRCLYLRSSDLPKPQSPALYWSQSRILPARRRLGSKPLRSRNLPMRLLLHARLLFKQAALSKTAPPGPLAPGCPSRPQHLESPQRP